MSEKLSYTVAEATRALGIGKTSLYELIQRGELETFKLCGRTLIHRSNLEALVERAREAKAA